jgi:hypothetical protein
VVSSGEEFRAGGGADRLDEEAVEVRAVLGDRIDVRRGDLSVAVERVIPQPASSASSTTTFGCDAAVSRQATARIRQASRRRMGLFPGRQIAERDEEVVGGGEGLGVFRLVEEAMLLSVVCR